MTLTDSSSLPDLLLRGGAGCPTEHLLVVVAHPDDETIAAGGLIHAAGRAGIRTTVIVATDGEGSHPDSPTHLPAQLGARRRDEVRAAVRTLNRQAELRLLGLPDGGLASRVETISALLRGQPDDLRPGTLLVSTWSRDGHPDHDAVGAACAALAAESGLRHLEAPIWAWEWNPESIPADRLIRHALDERAAETKAAALDCHRSQVEPLSDAPADAAVVTAALLRHAHRPVEILVDSSPRPSAGGQPFESMYDAGTDPWQFEDSWYEERKRGIVLASLLDRDLGRVLELGPATGLLTTALAERAENVTAVDISRRALEQVGARLARHGRRERVELIHGAIPQTWPAGPFETVIASEVAYFLTEETWRHTLQRATSSLTSEGSIVVVNWLHPVQGLALDGVGADRIAAEFAALETVVEHREMDFALRVLRRPGVPSPAEIEGLTPLAYGR
ncbi:MAG: bifunctional PIG-L family deacetylase/class I SAM-dependent methyltransferase [Actinomycetia bacterium]|nr:bifunctional PIG-L family deacetylase/class I SAM-dependent methyltransferase [Actinomycetes bacterium]